MGMPNWDESTQIMVSKYKPTAKETGGNVTGRRTTTANVDDKGNNPTAYGDLVQSTLST